MAKFQEFDESIETFDSCEERLQQYFLVHDTRNELKVANLITFLGAKVYQELKTTLYPDSPTGKTYTESRYLKGKVDERLKDYIAAIKELSKLCEFGEFLDEALRDRMVCRLREVQIQKKLLGEDGNLSFQRACEIALSMEVADAQSQLVQERVETPAKTQQKSKEKEQNGKVFKPCYRCGRKHNHNLCPAKNWECFNCKTKGHTSKMCKKGREKKEVCQVAEEESDDDDSLDCGYGVGAVLSHVIDGVELPVLFASSSLSETEQRYSNMKEKLSTITRWAITLSGYDYEIQYRKGKLIANADGLSRASTLEETEIPDTLYSFNTTDTIPLNDIAYVTKKDMLLSKVKDLTIAGWPAAMSGNEYKPFFQKRHELSVENHCLMYGTKVVIPRSLRIEVLSLSHEQHIVKINDEIKHIHVSSIRTYIDCEEENKIRLPVNIRAPEPIKANEALQERMQPNLEKERNRDLEKPEICEDAEAPQPNIKIPDSTL
ncbi:hypothetical protein Trydic_g8405 [Trypoxylus dichotomus]